MEITELEILAQMVRDANVGELTLRHEGERVTIRKSTGGTATTVTTVDEKPYAAQYGEIVEEDDGSVETVLDPVTLVTAPLVGVFRHVKPLVGLNARVTEGQVMGVIEAMKLITEVTAPETGTIVDVFIEAGHPVEYGQALFEIRPE